MLTKRPKATQQFSGIDVTALGSVMLVLVVLMMFTPRTYMSEDVQADLPKASHSSLMKGADRDDALVITVMRMGYCFLGRDRIAMEDLPKKIQAGLTNGSPRKIYIRADVRARYQDVKAVVDAIQQGGIENIAFLTDQRLPDQQKTSSPMLSFPSN